MNPEDDLDSFDETEWNPSDDPTDHPEFWEDSGRSPAEEIIDRVLDGEASDAKETIYSALYGKVGERIDSLRSELRDDLGTSEFSSEVDDSVSADDGIDDIDDLLTIPEE